MDIMTSGMKQKGNDTAGRTGNQKRIAIIEDDVHIGDIIEESLRREGYQTCRAYSGTEAQYLLADEDAGRKPDLVLLDLILPGMTGEALLSWIKNIRDTPDIRDISDIPIIVISAKVGLDDKVDALLGGAADYITKPFEIKELLARITVQLRRREVSASTEQTGDCRKGQDEGKLIVGDLTLDLVLREISSSKSAGAESGNARAVLESDSMSVRLIKTNSMPVRLAETDDMSVRSAEIDSMSVRLTRTEFAILRLLMQNAGQVFSKAAILDCISADTPDCTDSSLKQHISNLRKKLAEIGEGDCIEAVWGIGFRLKT